MQDSSSESEKEETSPQEEVKSAVQTQKQKKKRNKKKKAAAKVDSDEEFLEKITQTGTQPKGKQPVQIGESVLLMDRQHFNYRKELKALFTQL